MNITKHKSALVFFSAGVGDAILLVPLVNQLKKNGYKVTGLFTSPFNCESIFENTTLFDSIIIKKSKGALLLFSFFNFNKYDRVFLNHFAFSNLNSLTSVLIGKSIDSNYNHPFFLKFLNKINSQLPKLQTHDALQNALLFNNSLTLSDLDFNVNYKPKNTTEFVAEKKYVVVQVSSANNKAPYKNWSIEKWINLFAHLKLKLPNTKLILLGDESELHLNEKVKSIVNVTSLIGKTALNDVMEIIYHAQFYIGLDSGLMHIAVALNKPTFTIWGASNTQLYGYNVIQPKTHKISSLNLACSPCSSWLGANTTRVTDPLNCPDFKCINELSVLKVTHDLDDFINELQL